MDAGASSSLEPPKQCREFTLSEIHIATKNFDESLVIGRGGFGMVYKGTISDGTTHLVAAIKRLDATSNQGAEEFWSEVRVLSTLRHCHLVSLIGYCNDGQEMILVYEYMPHGTLEDHLHKFQSPLPWVRRLKICIGAARGLDYLHTGTGIMHGIIHRDVKSSNILLDDTWAAKISDFGLSKRGPINQPSTYVNTFVKGTFGYLDPDYYATGRLTRKSDVYAFGVVLFEVLSGKQAVDRSLDEEHWGLANWAQESIKKGRLKQIVDYNLRERILPKCLKEFGRLADRCLHSNPKQRPTMFEVVVCLESVLASQEKANHTWHPLGLRIFGKKVPASPFGSHGEKSGNIIHTQTHIVGYLDSVLSSANPNLPGSGVSGSGLSPNSNFSYGYASSPGKRSSMEDFYETIIDNVNGREIGLFGVFDGHGGARAAKYVKKNLFTNLIKHPKFISDTKSAIAEAYSHTDTEFLKSENDQNRDAGSTACTAIIVGTRLLVANVGDSGAVICRGGNAYAVSRDHRPNQSDERKRIEAAGGVVMWEGTWKVGGVVAVSRAFGYKFLKQFVVADPEIQEEKIDELEFLIVASDGLWDVVTDEEAVAMIKPVQRPEEAAMMLMQEASQRGSADNITVVVVRFLEYPRCIKLLELFDFVY